MVPAAAPAVAEDSSAARLVAGVIIGAALVLVLVAGIGALAAVLWLQPGSTPVAEPAAPSAVAVEPAVGASKDTTAREEKERRERFVGLMIQAGLDLREKRLDEALAGYSAALTLCPDDARATAGWLEAKAASTEVRQATAEQGRLKDDVAELVQQGQQALGKKQSAAALEVFKLAVQKAPHDAAANEGLRASASALGRDEAEQKRQADFDRHLSAGTLALKAGRHDDALRELIAAQSILPDDPAPRALQRQCEQELRALKSVQDRQAAFTKLMDRGNAALLGRQFDDAEQLFRQALQLKPDDATAQKAGADASRLARLMRDDFNTLMKRGAEARQGGRWLDAARAYREALQLYPTSDLAQKALREVEQAQDRVNAYQQAIRQGTLAMSRQAYLDAQVAFQSALKIAPNDVDATQGLLVVQQRLQQVALAKQESDRKAQLAAQALQQQKFADASKLLAEALLAFPNTPQAAFLQQQASYADIMAKGQAALAGKDFNEATRQFQAALALNPNDQVAQLYLIKSRNAR
jgi:tetratricopeptide (TPR) repeat protein